MSDRCHTHRGTRMTGICLERSINLIMLAGYQQTINPSAAQRMRAEELSGSALGSSVSFGRRQKLGNEAYRQESDGIDSELIIFGKCHDFKAGLLILIFRVLRK